MNMKNSMSSEGIDSLIEHTLREYLQPVTPRHEFVDKLRDKLEDDILPIQKKEIVSFRNLFEITIGTLALLVITVLTIRAVLLIISSWKIIRTSGAR